MQPRYFVLITHSGFSGCSAKQKNWSTAGNLFFLKHFFWIYISFYCSRCLCHLHGRRQTWKYTIPSTIKKCIPPPDFVVLSQAASCCILYNIWLLFCFSSVLQLFLVTSTKLFQHFLHCSIWTVNLKVFDSGRFILSSTWDMSRWWNQCGLYKLCY